MTNNGNRTEWSPVQSVNMRVIDKIGRRRMITCRIGRHEVLLRINQYFEKIQERNQTSAIRNVSKNKGQQRVHMSPTVHLYRHDVLLHCPITSMTRSLSY